ncbi:hypothetical protein ACQP1W_36915 [Spirillospora sp. CA-255316]
MSTRHPSQARPASARPGPARARLVAARAWDNRPNLGTLACLLAGPGVANVVLGWPLWWTAAGQWSLWLLLMLAVSLAEARHPTGHDVPSQLGTANGEEDDR